MVVDTSALMAILLQEPEASAYSSAIEGTAEGRIAAPTLVEASAVALGRGGARLLEHLKLLITESALEVVPFSPGHAEEAANAYLRFGKGVGKPGCLNMGDCFSYALARSLDAPLLYKGDDFAHTDIRSAL